MKPHSHCVEGLSMISDCVMGLDMRGVMANE